MKAYKRIICVFAGLLIVFSSALPALATDNFKELEDAFWNYCNKSIPAIDGQENKVSITDVFESENHIVFAADSWQGDDHGRHRRRIGQWDVESYRTHSPYDLGIYIFYDNNIYTLEEAVSKNLVSDLSPVNNFKGRRTAHIDDINRCTEAFLDYKGLATSDELWINCFVFGKTNNHTVFRADIETPDDVPAMNSEQVIGGYRFTYGTQNGPKNNPTGLYVLTSDDKVLSALEAYENALVSDHELARLANGTPYDKYDPFNQYFHEDFIISFLKENYLKESDWDVTDYAEVYTHYSDTQNKKISYVLFRIRNNMPLPDIPMTEIIGDYIIHGYSDILPIARGYGVFIPETNEIYGLAQAITLDIEGIEKAENQIDYHALMGDNDEDLKLTIKDATYLQKCLAGLKDFRKDDRIDAYEFDGNLKAGYISDYNRDGVRNIKDATAIQKKLAGY